MKKISVSKLSFLVAASTSILLSSCVSKFSAEDRAALSTVSVSVTSVNKAAYQEPHGGDREVGATVMAGTGGGLLGALIGEAVVGTQNVMYKNKNSKSFSAIYESTPKDLGRQYQGDLKSVVQQNYFFSKKLESGSSNKFTSEIESYGLVRTAKHSEAKEILLSPRVMVKHELIGGNGKKYLSKTFVGISNQVHSTSAYANNTKLLRKAYADALDVASANFQEYLEKKTAK